MSQLYSNNASTLLIEDLLPGDTTINLSPGAGDPFPLPDAGDPQSFFMLTLEDVSANFEICMCTERSGDILTVVRGQESTAPAGFAIGSRCETRLTAGSLANFKQVADQWSLRGDVIDSDGVRLWHQQDPSTYQFYTMRYYTADVFGFPVMHIEPPPSLPGLNFMAGVISSDGTQRVIRLGADVTGAAPAPATGEVHFEVPGILRWALLNAGLSGNVMYASFAKNENASGNLLKLETQGDEAAAYEFVTQDTTGQKWTGGWYNYGGGYMTDRLEILHAEKATYGDALDLSVKLRVNPFDPGNADYVAFTNKVGGLANRAFSYAFFTVRKDDVPDPVEYIQESVSIIDGGVWVLKDPTEGNYLTRRSWVEAQITAATTGTGLDTIAAALYGRADLFINSSGTNDGSVQTLLNSHSWSDFYQVEITAKDGDSIVVTRLDTQSLINNGYSPITYEIFQAEGTGGDIRKVYFNPLSLTTFSGSKTGNASGGIISIIGISPKVQPVV